MPDDIATTLSGIRERAEGPMRKFGDIDASQADVRILLAAIEAVLKLADKWSQDEYKGTSTLEWIHQQCAGRLREAITTPLTGKETGE